MIRGEPLGEKQFYRGHLVLPETREERHAIVNFGLDLCFEEFGGTTFLRPDNGTVGRACELVNNTEGIFVGRSMPLAIKRAGRREFNENMYRNSTGRQLMNQRSLWWCTAPNDDVWPREYYTDAQDGGPGRLVWDGPVPTLNVVDGPVELRGLPVWNGTSKYCESFLPCWANECYLKEGGALNTEVFDELWSDSMFQEHAEDMSGLATGAYRCLTFSLEERDVMHELLPVPRIVDCSESSLPDYSQLTLVEFEASAQHEHGPDSQERTSWVACGPGGLCECNKPVPTDAYGEFGRIDCSGHNLLTAPAINVRAAVFLDLHGNFLESIDTSLVADTVLPDLEVLRVSYNRLRTVPAISNKQLKHFVLHGNRISSFAPGAFDKTPNLLEIMLSDNPIPFIPSGILDSLQRLERLDLHNCFITVLQQGVFGQVRSLKYLNLYNAPIRAISRNLFATNSVRWRAREEYVEFNVSASSPISVATCGPLNCTEVDGRIRKLCNYSELLGEGPAEYDLGLNIACTWYHPPYPCACLCRCTLMHADARICHCATAGGHDRMW